MNVDYLELRGPKTLTELVAAIDSSAPAPVEDVTIVELGGDEWAQVQYDQVDDDTWPYMITVESRSDAEAPVRAQSTRLFDLLNGRGWNVQMTSDFDDTMQRTR